MPSVNIFGMAISDPEIHSVIFDLTKSIAGHSDLETLCQALAASLRRVVNFDDLGVALHDPIRNEFRLHALSTNRPPPEEIPIPAGGNPLAEWVWREQKPLVLPSLEDETRGGEVIRIAREGGVRALIVVPLSNGDKRLGFLGFGFIQPYQPDDHVLEFLQRVASEFAVAVDGYLARNALQKERDRIHALFEITTALVSKLPMDELLHEISSQLSKVVAHDAAVLVRLDKTTGTVHLSALDSPGGVPFEREDKFGSPDGLPAGEAIATRQPVVTSGVDFDRFYSPLYRELVDRGFHSACSIPLISGDEVIGVLDLIRREDSFRHDEVQLLVQVGRQVAIAVENSLAYREVSELKDRLAKEKLYLEEEIRLDQNAGSMVGESPAFRAVWRSIQIVAPTDSTVLVQGETGTGKELVARAIHDLSGRSERSFIKVNCAAIPATLLESELFGHERGSFTGAHAQKIGRFELAHQGTLFLDEIGEIPLELQPKLLRAIQEQELERLGGNRTIHVDVRFVAATNRNLKQMVDEGKFRSDLYYRLNVFPLTVPPLRERRDDIPLLVRYFAQKHATRMKREIEEIPSASLDALTRYEWPGNIRELQNVIERSVILSPGRVLHVALPELPVAQATRIRPGAIAEAAERDRIMQALEECGWRVAGADGAAALLGMRRTTLQSRMQRLKIERQYK